VKNNLDHISEILKKTIFWVKILKFFDAYPGSGINIPDPQRCLLALLRIRIRPGHFDADPDPVGSTGTSVEKLINIL
jgi:hypothetical protein